jgi:hypothetical protein
MCSLHITTICSSVATCRILCCSANGVKRKGKKTRPTKEELGSILLIKKKISTKIHLDENLNLGGPGHTSTSSTN